VVRVEHFKDGRARVAVRLLKSTEGRAAHKVHPFRAEETKKSPIPEHRLAPRLPFLTEAEVMEPTTGTWLKTRLSDLSLSGCYVDTLHPLPVGDDSHDVPGTDHGSAPTGSGCSVST